MDIARNMENPEYGQENDSRNDVTGKSRMRRSMRGLLGMRPLFLFTVVVPTLLAILYFGFLASDVYISTSRFVVRGPEKQSSSGLGMLLDSTGFAGGGNEVYAAQGYLLSRDALRALNRQNAFVRAYTMPSVSILDRFAPSGLRDSFEDLYEYYKKKVEVEQDSTSSIVTLSVHAFTPQDAYRFNGQLLEMAEATVNNLNERGRADLIRFARREVDDAKDRSRSAALALSAYRNQAGVLDPEKQATVQIELISRLQSELIATQAQLRQLRTFTPQNPQIMALDNRARGLSAEIGRQLGSVAGANRSLSTRAAQYQRLLLDSQFADKQLAVSMASFEQASNEARRQQSYVERIVSPNLPDKALLPRRMRGIVSTLILGLAAWAIISMLVAGMLEHRD